ncbi:hypothetical protein G7Z17_g2380 [Cylindrodendrum hubeiense]|uniref:Glutamine amidotransferase domain-containing protein n=1 Tax=Cylindrodendrum hubeiense TaxID=595255 RepID=A0A9P5HCX6_9HYPO|nr:hypothetical protein G7Z17_g2380 [Cylindrodendrum hubeiense]
MTSVFRLAILETDKTPSSISDTQGSYGDIVERLVRRGFEQAEGPVPELQITKWDVVKAQSYPRLDEIDGILARALGGRVIKNPKGCELSVTKVDLTPSGIDLFGVGHLNLHQMHLDTVVETPPGMEILGSSAISEVQFMYEPGRVLGIQGHPEANAFIIKQYLDSRFEQNLIEDREYQEALSKIDSEHDGDLFAKAIPKFLFEKRP